MIFARVPQLGCGDCEPLGLHSYSQAETLGLHSYSRAVTLGQNFINVQDVVRTIQSNPLPWSYDDARFVVSDALRVAQQAVTDGHDLPGGSRRDTVLGKIQFHNNVLNSVDVDQTDAPYMGSWDLAQWAVQAAIEYNAVVAGVDSLSLLSSLRQTAAALAAKPRQFIQGIRDDLAQAAQSLADQARAALDSAKQDAIDAAAEASNKFVAANAAHPFQVQVNPTTIIVAAVGVAAVAGLAYLVYRVVSKA